MYSRGEGIILNEPTVIALNSRTNEVLAIGHEAWQMIGRTPGYIVAVRPLRGGAITDFEITERLIRLLFERAGVSRFYRTRVLICVPSAITHVEQRAVLEAARRAGAAQTFLIEQPMAAAIGASLPIHEPLGDLEVGDGAAPQGAHGHDVPGRAADHLPRLVTDREHLVGAVVERDDRRLVDNDAFAA